MISVIIPMYNAEKYIEKCLHSVLKQTYDDYEVVVVNDGSNDHSVDIIKSLNSNKIRLISKENQGLPQARKTGYENARGDYIFFLDSDDWIDSNLLQSLVDCFEKEENVDVVSCNVEYDDEQGKTIKLLKGRSGCFESIDSLKNIHDHTNIFNFLWNKLYTRKILERIRFPEGNFLGEDYCTLMSLMVGEIKIVHNDNFFYHYVQHTNNMSKKGFDKTYRLAYNNYEICRNEMLQRYSLLKNSINNYHLLEKMAILNAMIRNDHYDKEMMDAIREFIKTNLWMYIIDKHVKLLYKASAVFIIVNFKFYRKIYRTFMMS